MTAPIATGRSKSCRVGRAPTGKGLPFHGVRRTLVTQCCEPPQHSMPIRHDCRLAKCSRNSSRLSCRLTLERSPRPFTSGTLMPSDREGPLNPDVRLSVIHGATAAPLYSARRAARWVTDASFSFLGGMRPPPFSQTRSKPVFMRLPCLVLGATNTYLPRVST